MTLGTTVPDWDLSLLYVLDSPELESALGQARAITEHFPLWKERLYKEDFTVAEFESLVGDLVHMHELGSKLCGFGGLSMAEDTQSQKALAFMGRVEEVMAELSNASLFFVLWFQELPEERAEGYLKALGKHSYYLRRLRAEKPYTLSEAEEKVINFKDITGREALITLYDSLTGRYEFQSGFAPELNGEKLSREELSVYVRSHSPKVREEAYKELYRVYSKDGPILSQIYQALCRDWRLENVKLRGHAFPQAARNLRNDLTDRDVECLLKVCKEEAPFVFGDYFKKKAKLLGFDKLRRYDIYAPYLAKKDETIPFSEAMNEVREAFRVFSPEMADMAYSILEAKHLSASLLPNKRSGAFCASISPEEAPWVLMSYKGKREDLFTLAHELGHAVHSLLAKDKGIFEFEATLPLAETASTFGEMLLAQRYMEKSGDKDSMTDILLHILDDAYATVGRQAFFALFEVEAHNLINEGATSEDLKKAYFTNLKTQFGDSLELNPEFAWEWVTIPHFFHTPFYVYAYSFGQLLVYSLWNLYMEEGPSFAPKLIRILSAGSSASPADILASAKVGPLDEEFWRGGFKVIRGFLERL
jgi:oligoendopeptidase F